MNTEPNLINYFKVFINSITLVPKPVPRFIFKIFNIFIQNFKSFYMSFSKIHYMNIISNACAIRSFPIITKYFYFFNFPKATFVIKGNILFGMPLGSSPMRLEGCAPIGLKYLRFIIFHFLGEL